MITVLLCLVCFVVGLVVAVFLLLWSADKKGEDKHRGSYYDFYTTSYRDY